MKYAIKVNEEKRQEIYKGYGLGAPLIHGQYVDKTGDHYTAKEDAESWDTEEEAASCITEPWEEVVKI